MTDSSNDSAGGFSGPDEPQSPQSQMLSEEPERMQSETPVNEEPEEPERTESEMQNTVQTVFSPEKISSVASFGSTSAYHRPITTYFSPRTTTTTYYSPRNLPAYSTTIVRGGAPPITVSSPRSAAVSPVSAGTPRSRTVIVNTRRVNERGEPIPLSSTVTTSPRLAATSSPRVTTATRSTTSGVTSSAPVMSTTYTYSVPVSTIVFPAIVAKRNPAVNAEALSRLNFDTSELFKPTGGAQEPHISNASMQARLDPESAKQRTAETKVQKMVDNHPSQLQGQLQELRSELQDRVEDDKTDLGYAQQGPRSVLPRSIAPSKKLKKQTLCC